ncbi:MAG TPA: hypothetical protein DEP66_03855 [Acidimicrobiaceae bacterium]|nr:hypothetical protein [Acidimicrobiaceae bacterium]
MDFGETEAVYRWSDAAGGWLRSQAGTPHLDAGGRRIAPENVIVQFVAYGRSAADARSPEAVLLGEGEAWVLTAGEVVPARWSRAAAETPTVFTRAAAGAEPVALTPGRTWVALARVGQATLLEPDG